MHNRAENCKVFKKVSFFPKKMKAFPEKKIKHNILQSVENSVVKGRNACMEKGFNVQSSVI